MMDNHEIKHAICRAKERRRARYNRRKVCKIVSLLFALVLMSILYLLVCLCFQINWWVFCRLGIIHIDNFYVLKIFEASLGLATKNLSCPNMYSNLAHVFDYSRVPDEPVLGGCWVFCLPMFSIFGDIFFNGSPIVLIVGFHSEQSGR